MSVVKDTGARATMPPFMDEHEELRDSVSRFVSAEITPHVWASESIWHSPFSAEPSGVPSSK